MQSKPRLLQGIYSFTGRGLNAPCLLDGELVYEVPMRAQAQLVYFRAGNSADEMINLLVLRDGLPMRLFPIGSRGDCHVTLAVVEDLPPGTRLEVHVAAPVGTQGSAVVDVGLIETLDTGSLAEAGRW